MGAPGLGGGVDVLAARKGNVGEPRAGPWIREFFPDRVTGKKKVMYLVWGGEGVLLSAPVCKKNPTNIEGGQAAPQTESKTEHGPPKNYGEN